MMAAKSHTLRGAAGIMLLLALAMACATSAVAQTKQISKLKKQRSQLEQGIKRQQGKLLQTRHEAGKKQQSVDFMEVQLGERLRYIHQLEGEMDSLERHIDTLTAHVALLDTQLNERREKYKRSLRLSRPSASLRNPLLFALTANTFPQAWRRLRYAREYAAAQRDLGLRVMQKQDQLRSARSRLLDAKHERSGTVQEIIRQRQRLTSSHAVASANVAELRKQARAIERDVAEQSKKLNALNKRIDELVQIEIEKARKRAEAEARRKREAEERRRREQQAARAARSKKSRGGSGRGSSVGKSDAGKDSGGRERSSDRWLTSEDRKLNGSMEQNRGRLPVPITGPYRLYRRFGLNRIAPGVTLDNKGVHYMGQDGARARSVWDGEVSAIFEMAGSKHVLVRHGSYISVYSGLSSVIVHKGQHVKARDIIGTVASDDQGQRLLQFQLRRETAKLNPEVWVGR